MKNTTINVKCEAAKTELRINQKKIKFMITERGVSNDGNYVIDSDKYGTVNKVYILEVQSVLLANSIRRWKQELGMQVEFCRDWQIFGKLQRSTQEPR